MPPEQARVVAEVDVALAGEGGASGAAGTLAIRRTGAGRRSRRSGRSGTSGFFPLRTSFEVHLDDR